MITNGKCTNCNAGLNFEAGKNIVKCEYCRSTFYINQNAKPGEQVISAVPNVTSRPDIFAGHTFTSNANTNKELKKEKIPPRPVINIFILVIGCMIYFFPGVIYLISVLHKQAEWDRKYAQK